MPAALLDRQIANTQDDFADRTSPSIGEQPAKSRRRLEQKQPHLVLILSAESLISHPYVLSTEKCRPHLSERHRIHHRSHSSQYSWRNTAPPEHCIPGICPSRPKRFRPQKMSCTCISRSTCRAQHNNVACTSKGGTFPSGQYISSLAAGIPGAYFHLVQDLGQIRRQVRPNLSLDL